MLNFLQKLFGSSNDRLLKNWSLSLSQQINLRKIWKIQWWSTFKKHTGIQEKIKNGINIDDLIPESFANVRENKKGQRHYDVQIMGGVVLHQGMIAEMKTGEGKTLVSTLAAYLNSLSGNPSILLQ